jgi:hypothetical protein
VGLDGGRSARGGDCYLATSGDLDLATSGYFFMATDNLPGHPNGHAAAPVTLGRRSAEIRTSFPYSYGGQECCRH